MVRTLGFLSLPLPHVPSPTPHVAIAISPASQAGIAAALPVPVDKFSNESTLRLFILIRSCVPASGVAGAFAVNVSSG